MDASRRQIIRTMSPMNCHPTLCGMLVEVEDGRLVKVSGDQENPDSRGSLCVRGQASREVIGNSARLLRPLVRTRRTEDAWREARWDEVLGLISGRMQAAGREAVGIWAGHGAFTTGIGALRVSHVAYPDGRFHTPSGKVEFYSERAQALGLPPLPVYKELPKSSYPLAFRQGRTLTHFHAFYDHGRALPMLARLDPEPWLWISPTDAAVRELPDGAAIEPIPSPGAHWGRYFMNGMEWIVFPSPFCQAKGGGKSKYLPLSALPEGEGEVRKSKLPFRPTIMGTHGMVATEHYLSALIGVQVLQQGGNAVDAAVAAIFAEGVLNPHMHTIGGEVPMLIAMSDKAPAGAQRSQADWSYQVSAINGNTVAPQRATIEWFASQQLSLIPGEGLLAAGVPAAFDALITALDRFGTLTLAEVLEPALALASQGFPMHHGLRGPSDYLSWSIWHNVKKFQEDWPTSAQIYLPQGRLPEVGDIFCNGDLARTFERLLHAERAGSSHGRAAGLTAARDLFYRGEIAQQIIAFAQRHGGLLEPDDLAVFETKVETPVSLTYRGYEVFKCGPWSQGPVFLQQLRLLEGYDVRALGHNTPAYIHLLTEVAKLAFADREAYYGDPVFVHVPMHELLSEGYAAVRRTLIDPERASLKLRPGDPLLGKPLRPGQGNLVGREWQRGTVHVAVVDRERNLVAATPSGAWITGSPVVEGLGFPLGTRMQVFYLDRDHPNALAPRKQPRTTLTPSLVMRDGKPYMAFGTMGLDQQDQWTLQCFLNVVEFGMSLQEAIEAPKFSSQHFPSSIYPHTANPGLLRVEGRIPYEVRRALQAKGHQIAMQPDWIEGYIVGVQVDADRGVIYGGADPRGELTSLLPAYAIGW